MAKTPLQTAEEHHGGGHHVASVPTLVAVLIALTVLMVVTVGASWVELPSIGPLHGVIINNLIAMAIAVVKACLVIWYFMGVRWATALTRIWVVAGFLVLILMFGILGDYFTRQYEPVAGWEKEVPISGGESALPRQWPPHGRVVPPNNNGFMPRNHQNVNPNTVEKAGGHSAAPSTEGAH